MGINLDQLDATFPIGGKSIILWIDLPNLLRDMINMNNHNVALLENSIRQLANISYYLNAVACITAVSGFLCRFINHLKK
jgi:hypothetical protein